MRISLIFLIVLIFLGTSCTKEHDLMDVDEEELTPITNVEVSSLIVSIGEDKPFSCIINGKEYFSEETGILLLNNILLEKEGNSILVKSDGHFDEVRYVVPSLGAHLFLEVQLTETDNTNTGGFVKKVYGFDTKEGGTISAFKIDIKIEPNTFLDAQGDAYDGKANIFFYSLFNTAYITNIRSFPQIHFVEDRKDNIFNLYGGVNIVVMDESMNPLFVKEGFSVDIDFDAFSTIFDVPNILEIRYFDEHMGVWQNSEKAEKGEEKWKTTISDLGIIAWGISYESRPAEARLVTDEGVPIPNKFVWLSTGAYETATNIAFSDSEGKIRVHVPVGNDFSLSTVKSASNPPTTFKNYSIVGSGAEELIKLDDFVLNSEDFQVYTGNVVGCHGDVIKQSAIITNSPKEFGTSKYISYVFSDENGMYNFAFPKDNINEIKFSAFDVVANLESSKYFVSNIDEQAVDFGNLLVCVDLEYFINYSIEGKQYTYAFDGDYSSILLGPQYESTFTANAVSGASENNRTSFTIEHSWDLQLNSSYEIKDLAIKLNNSQDSYTFVCNSDCSHSVFISRITTDYYEGLLKHTDSSNSQVIIGAFRIPRQ